MRLRQPHLGDVIAAARVLLTVEADRRPDLLGSLLAQASTADAHSRSTGQVHPRFGDGSLMGAALRHGAVREPGLEDEDYRACLVAVLSAL